MARHADPPIPDTPEEWLDGFNTFSIYQVLPQITELWGLNVQTDVQSKKTSSHRKGNDHAAVPPALRTAWHFHPRPRSALHYRALLRVENDDAWNWYMEESVRAGWSSRQLERQISTLYYDRLLSSRDKASVVDEADKLMEPLAAEDFIKDPLETAERVQNTAQDGQRLRMPEPRNRPESALAQGDNGLPVSCGNPAELTGAGIRAQTRFSSEWNPCQRALDTYPCGGRLDIAGRICYHFFTLTR